MGVVTARGAWFASETTMSMLRAAVALVGEYRRSYCVLNVVYYGLVIAAMGYTMFDRGVQTALQEAARASLKEGLLAPVAGAYASGVPAAMAMTFGVNLTVGSFLSITLPSLVIPFSGLLVGAWRAVLWGLMFAPQTLEVGPASLARGSLVALLILLEGQGYVLTMLAAYAQGKALVAPASVGAIGRWHGYRVGLGRSLRLYLLVAGTLAIAAVYEALVVIVVMPALA